MASEQPRASSKGRLAVLDERGSRLYAYPSEASGRYTSRKQWVHLLLLTIYLIVPFLTINDNPVLLLDIANRRFVVLGKFFNAQDFYLSFFLVTGAGFTLIVLSSLFGRIWCGWACPQIVFLESIFRRVERWTEGTASQRRKLASAPWSLNKFARRTAKHSLYLTITLCVSNVFLAYFVSVPSLVEMMQRPPSQNWVAFLWMAGFSGLVYFNFYWFREQMCLVLCPYGRLQSALQDPQTILIGYDQHRGEPRGKVKNTAAGDCVDCKRCISVCPTGIDIREGFQFECIGCAKCIDACDDIMAKLGRNEGLVRYDSLRGLQGGVRRFWRPRIGFYLIAGILGSAVAVTMWLDNQSVEANVVRTFTAPYILDGSQVRNTFMVHVVNKHSMPTRLELKATPNQALNITIPQPVITLEVLDDHQLPVIVSQSLAAFAPGVRVHLDLTDDLTGETNRITTDFLGPDSPVEYRQPHE